MEAKALLALAAFCCLLWGGVRCSRISLENDIWEEGFQGGRSGKGASEPELYGTSSAGPEKLAIDILTIEKKELEEVKGREKLSGFQVDEETIREAEKMADKDLLNGLNRILKNNETLRDVFRTENVYEIP